MLIAQSQCDWATVVRHGYLLLAELTESASTLPVTGLGDGSVYDGLFEFGGQLCNCVLENVQLSLVQVIRRKN